MKRKKKRRAALPKISARAVSDLHRAAFGTPTPKGWHVEWVGYMRGAIGLCCYGERTIKLSYGDLRTGKHRAGETVLEVLLHEFVHVRCPGLRHGDEFDTLVRLACEEVGVEVRRHLPHVRAEERAMRASIRAMRERRAA